MADQQELFDPRSCDVMDLLEHLGDTPGSDLKWPQRLRNLYEVQRHYNLRKGMTADDADRDARDRCILISEYFGGRTLHLPRGTDLRSALTHMELWRRFNGRNHLDLAEQYGYDVAHVYVILRQQQALHARPLPQGKLFEAS